MTDDVIKMSEEMDKKIKDYMKAKDCDRKTAEEALMKAFDEVETLKATNEQLRKGLLDEGYRITEEGIEKKAPVEYIEYDGEKINKADVPAPILKKLEEAEAKEADAQLTKRADEKLPNFEQSVAKKLIQLVEKSDDVDILLQALEAADKAFADKMEELGKSNTEGDMSDASVKLEQLVKAYRESNDATYARAYAAVVKTDEGKALVKELYKKG